MRQRRVKFPSQSRSIYEIAFKNHYDKGRNQIRPVMKINLDQEHKINPLKTVQSITAENSLYRSDFNNKVGSLAQDRLIMDDRENGNQIKQRGKRPHIDMEDNAPIPRSSYMANFFPFEIKGKLVECEPQYPRYSLRWVADSEYRQLNKHLSGSISNFKRRNIVITEPKRPFQMTKPICAVSKGEYLTEKKQRDSYLND